MQRGQGILQRGVPMPADSHGRGGDPEEGELLDGRNQACSRSFALLSFFPGVLTPPERCQEPPPRRLRLLITDRE